MPKSLEEAEEYIKPSKPWAELQFRERVCGFPYNPGFTYHKWPFYGSDKKMRNIEYRFSHTYMERFWPKYANKVNDDEHTVDYSAIAPNTGLRFDLGDYNDVIDLLKREKHTRQAYLPIFFPEDTGATHRSRVPCSLGYWFYLDADKNQLHMTYHIRSCDYFRHFKDDIYMAIRLAQWTKDKLL